MHNIQMTGICIAHKLETGFKKAVDEILVISVK